MWMGAYFLHETLRWVLDSVQNLEGVAYCCMKLNKLKAMLSIGNLSSEISRKNSIIYSNLVQQILEAISVHPILFHTLDF